MQTYLPNRFDTRITERKAPYTKPASLARPSRRKRFHKAWEWNLENRRELALRSSNGEGWRRPELVRCPPKDREGSGDDCRDGTATSRIERKVRKSGRKKATEHEPSPKLSFAATHLLTFLSKWTAPMSYGFHLTVKAGHRRPPGFCAAGDAHVRLRFGDCLVMDEVVGWNPYPLDRYNRGSRFNKAQYLWQPCYSLPSINVNPREWIKVNIYRGVNN